MGKGRMTNMVSNSTVTQKTGGRGGSSGQSTSVGSGSRPGKGKFTIGSSNPVSSQRIRPRNPTEGTGYKG